MSVDLNIRVASLNDLPAILALYAQPNLDNGEKLSLNDAETIFERCHSYPDYQFYVAIQTLNQEHRVVGTFSLLVMDNLGHLGAKSAIVEAVAVDPDCQGGGIGKVMMEHARELARSKGCYKLTLSSNLKREAAHRFYNGLGFERHGYSFKVSP